MPLAVTPQTNKISITCSWTVNDGNFDNLKVTILYLCDTCHVTIVTCRQGLVSEPTHPPPPSMGAVHASEMAPPPSPPDTDRFMISEYRISLSTPRFSGTLEQLRSSTPSGEKCCQCRSWEPSSLCKRASATTFRCEQ